MKLVVIGSSNMDLVIRVPRIPVVGETIIGSESQMIFGGKGANQAIAAKRAGGDVLLIAKVGMDVYGTDMLAHFEEEGLSTIAIERDPKHPSGVAQIWVSHKGENSIVVAPGANMELNPTDIDKHGNAIDAAVIVLLQLETPMKTVEYILERCTRSSTKAILNPAPAAELSEAILSGLYLITPNETEASLLTGVEVVDHTSAAKAASILYKKGIQNVIITMGADGCLLFNSEGVNIYPAIPVKAIDTTAAGDVFNGVLAASLTLNYNLHQSIQMATAASSIAVTRLGAQPSAPYAEEIKRLLTTL